MKCSKKEEVWTVLPILPSLPTTIIVCIILSIAVSKLYSLNYPADDANVLQTVLCSILIRGKMSSYKMQSCHMPGILKKFQLLSLILLFPKMCESVCQNELVFWKIFVTNGWPFQVETYQSFITLWHSTVFDICLTIFRSPLAVFTISLLIFCDIRH